MTGFGPLLCEAYRGGTLEEFPKILLSENPMFTDAVSCMSNTLHNPEQYPQKLYESIGFEALCPTGRFKRSYLAKVVKC